MRHITSLSAAAAESDLEFELRQPRDIPFTGIFRCTPEQPCCSTPTNFVAIPNLSRDLHTGELIGSIYRCTNCGTPICEEDYASMMQWWENQQKLRREIAAANAARKRVA